MSPLVCIQDSEQMFVGVTHVFVRGMNSGRNRAASRAKKKTVKHHVNNESAKLGERFIIHKTN